MIWNKCSRPLDGLVGLPWFCTPSRAGVSVIANPTGGGVGDGLLPDQIRFVLVREAAVGHSAIAAGLAAQDLSASERLVAFSLASFANSDQLAWPGTSVAAARAGLGRSAFLAARRPRSPLPNKGSSSPQRSRGSAHHRPHQPRTQPHHRQQHADARPRVTFARLLHVPG